jgi:hypothetical protein
MGMVMTSKRTSRRSALRARIRPARRAGEGLAWLIFDAGGGLFQYQCYWKGGHCDDHLIEHARMATDTDAVDWAAARTPRARIRMPDHRTYWAGSAPRPNGFAGTWRGPIATSNPDPVPVLV